jgi:type IV pilus assembly protein PilA
MAAHGGATGDDGFSLIELMMVVLIIAILLVVAVPLMLGARDRADDKATESNVRNAFAAVRVFYSDGGKFTADPVKMTGVEPSLTWTNTPLDGSQPNNAVYIETQDVPTASQTVVIVGRTKHGRCFAVRDTMSGLPTGTHYAVQSSAGTACTVPASSDPAWSDSWA